MESLTSSRRIKTLSITSGKGGVGKTSVVANLAYSLGRRGRRALILDGDLGMANVDVMFGVRPEKNLEHLIRGEAEMREVIINVAPNVDLLPAGHGVLELQNLSLLQKRLLMDQVSGLRGYDYLLIDTAPGIDDHVLYLNSAAQNIYVIITPDPASLTDSYALMKVLNHVYRETRFKIICNQVRDEKEGLALFQRIGDVAEKFLFLSLDYEGSIPFDLNLRQSVRGQKLVCQTLPTSVAAQSLDRIAKNINGTEDLEYVKGGMQFFWQELIGVA
jgi:flagellar biosynthesis protein FlhG